MQSIYLSFDTLLYALIPLVIIQLALLIYGVYDWIKQGESLDNRFLWLLLILFISFAGPIIYFLLAPRESRDI